MSTISVIKINSVSCSIELLYCACHLMFDLCHQPVYVLICSIFTAFYTKFIFFFYVLSVLLYVAQIGLKTVLSTFCYYTSYNFWCYVLYQCERRPVYKRNDIFQVLTVICCIELHVLSCNIHRYRVSCTLHCLIA